MRGWRGLWGGGGGGLCWSEGEVKGREACDLTGEKCVVSGINPELDVH
jgi:hypothetical protein